MESVQNFNTELSSMYDFKIPISKAKMGSITKSAMKAIKFYKHVVQSVEKFILKCKPEYKIPGLYVIDSIVRQSRHQFGAEKDVFAPRFARNMEETFAHLFRCSQEDKSKIIRVLNLWQKNNVFAPDVIQPLFDLADPDHPVHVAFKQSQQNELTCMSNGMNNSPGQNLQDDHQNNDSFTALNIQKFQQYQQMLLSQSNVDQIGGNSDAVKFNKSLLDFDSESENEDKTDSSHQQNQNIQNYLNNNNFSQILSDPNVLKQLQNLQKVDLTRHPNEMPSASNAMYQNVGPGGGLTLANINNLRGGANQQLPSNMMDNKEQDVELIGDSGNAEIINLDGNSRSPTPNRYKRRKSRSRSRDRDRRDRRRRSRSKSRSRSRSRSPRSSRRRSSRDRLKEKEREKEREVEKERRRKGLPEIKKEHLSVCSTTLWVGHLSKLVQQEELSDNFGKFGDIVSIDMIPPRGCAYIVMNRRQDAYKAIGSLKSHKMQGRAITLSWAAGKGVKSKEWKDYFDQALGCSYVPFTKLNQSTNFESMEEGGMFDDDTMPSWMKEKLKQPQAPPVTQPKDLLLPSFFGMPSEVDTSQPPPNSALMPPFAMAGLPRLMAPMIPMPLGVPPPGMMMPGMPPMNKSIPPPLAGLMGFGLPPAQLQHLQQQQVHQQHQLISNNTDDLMDIEMEDEHTNSKPDGNMMQQQGFYCHPPPTLGMSLMMGATGPGLPPPHQNPPPIIDNNIQNNDNNRQMNRNNRSQSREKERGDFRSGGRDRERNDRDRRDFNRGNSGSDNRSQRWNNNESNGRGGDRRGGDRSRDDFNRGGDDFDRRGGDFNRGGRFNSGTRGRGGAAPFNRGGRGGRGFHNNNFNERPGFFERGNSMERPRGGGGRQNWREDDNNDRNSRSGNNFNSRFDKNNRKSSSRWTGQNRDDDQGQDENIDDNGDKNENTNDDWSSQDQDRGTRDENFEDNGPPGFEIENQPEPVPEKEDIEPQSFENGNDENGTSSENKEFKEPEQESNTDQNQISNEEAPNEIENAGNTTPLCDEQENKD
ncbi:unnamed protein product [Diamesa serratosioi]